MNSVLESLKFSSFLSRLTEFSLLRGPSEWVCTSILVLEHPLDCLEEWVVLDMIWSSGGNFGNGSFLFSVFRRSYVVVSQFGTWLLFVWLHIGVLYLHFEGDVLLENISTVG